MVSVGTLSVLYFVDSLSNPLQPAPFSTNRNEGPNKEKENLLLLDKVEDWLGRRRPTLLGKAGVAAAEERGEGALANILDMDKEEDSLGDKSEDEIGIKGWVEGVGEGRLDDENLVAYFRFSEGEDEESPWRTEGFSDLSRFENKATIVGQGKGCTLQPTTSSCDEGEQGKVKILYDLVFEEAADQEPSGLAMAANRGGSLDVGVLHSREHSSRQRSTVEFWYYIPKASMVSNAIVLARRTIGEDADDFSKACVASDKRSMLWEVVLLKSGELEFRTCAGGVISSKQDQDDEEDHVTADGTEKKGVAKFEGWNHLCLILSSRDADNISFCSVSMFMMGTSVGSADVSVLPQGLDKESLKDDAQLGKFMQKSHLVFGLDHSASFRLTEIRVWACERSEDDIKMMMRESLDAAEARKKKFRVKIGKNKQKAGGGAGLLAPPKPGLAPKGLAPPKGGGVRAGRSGLLSPPKAGLLGSPKDRREISANSEEGQKESAFNPGDKEAGEPAIEATVFDTAFGNFDSSEKQVSKSGVDFPSTGNVDFGGSGDSGAFQGNDDGNPVANDDGALAQNTAETQRQSLWDGAVPLSQQVRSSAAAALIRGPPATRHFGGNRGGLPDLRGTDRYVII